MAIELCALDRIDWELVAHEPTRFADAHGLSLGATSDLLRVVAQQTAALLGRTGAALPPWTGYLAVDEAGLIVGTCAFKAPPDPDGVVEIAYFTFPPFEGRGIASAMAAALVERARHEPGVRRLRAHTRPGANASTRILEKTGFDRVGEIVDPDDGLVWRWERAASSTDSSDD
jgi:ribosomal protein S18 acetylase RimI-like enzyme